MSTKVSFFANGLMARRRKKIVVFKDVVTFQDDVEDVPALGRLREFYKTFGSVLFYHDEKSGDAARRLAPTTEWEYLDAAFSDWIDDLNDEEREDTLPDWIGSCLVIGEAPHSGNYILVATKEPAKGRIFEFDHDGFEFTEVANNVIDYAKKLLKPDAKRLTDMASHMRFVEGDPKVQWWIREFRDNVGHTASTET